MPLWELTEFFFFWGGGDVLYLKDEVLFSFLLSSANEQIVPQFSDALTLNDLPNSMI